MLFWDLLESVWCCAACNSGLCFICFELMRIIRIPLVLCFFSVGLSGLVQRCFGALRFGSVLGCAGWVCVLVSCHMAVLGQWWLELNAF